MNDLLNKKCIPCEGGVKAFDISEIHKYQKKVDGWEIVQNDKKAYLLEKKFEFKNFLDSQKFVNEVGKVSEDEGHHPDIIFGPTSDSHDLSGFLSISFVSFKHLCSSHCNTF